MKSTASWSLTLTGEVLGRRLHAFVFPASHYVTSRERMLEAAGEIEMELAQQLEKFQQEGKLLEAQRIEQRTRFDLEMIREVGYCKGSKTIPAILRDEPRANRPIP